MRVGRRRAARARTEKHAAHAAALDLHRHRVVLVGQQRHFGHVRKHAGDLADDAVDRNDLHRAVWHGEQVLREKLASIGACVGGATQVDEMRAIVCRIQLAAEARVPPRCLCQRGHAPGDLGKQSQGSRVGHFGDGQMIRTPRIEAGS